MSISIKDIMVVENMVRGDEGTFEICNVPFGTLAKVSFRHTDGDVTFLIPAIISIPGMIQILILRNDLVDDVAELYSCVVGLLKQGI